LVWLPFGSVRQTIWPKVEECQMKIVSGAAIDFRFAMK